MHDSTSSSYTPPASKGIPSDEETLRRQAFQAVHPEVWFAWQDERWVARWADEARVPQRRAAVTLTGLLDELEPLFG